MSDNIKFRKQLGEVHRLAAGALGEMALALASGRLRRGQLEAWRRSLHASAAMLDGLGTGPATPPGVE
jgi:hypothetical protein